MRGGAGGDGDNDELASVVLQYLNSVFHGAHPQSSMSLRNSREPRTIAECMDALLAGDLPHLGDLLMQRLKAVQTAVVEGNWNLAQHLELIPTSGSNVVAPAELTAAQRTQLDQLCLQNSGKGGGKGSARTPPQGLGQGGGRASLSPLRPPPRAFASTLRWKKGSRKERWRSSHRSTPNARSPVPVPTPKSPPPLQKARPFASPARTDPPLQASVRRTTSRSPSAGVGSVPKSPHAPRQVAMRSFQQD